MDTAAYASGLRLRPCLSTYIVLDGVFFAPLVLIGAASALRGIRAWDVIVVFCFALVATHTWIRSNWIDLSDKGLLYHTLLGRKSIAFSAVESFCLDVGVQDSFKERVRCPGFYRLVIRSNDSGVAPLVINVKLFSLADVRGVLSVLEDRCVGKVRGVDNGGLPVGK
ncbi:MAG: hypothetical protein ABFC96_00220 [Thermoguttaceae bacterium]